MWVLAPIRDTSGEILAALVVGHYAHEDFSSIIEVGNLGETGEAYAFNTEGIMVSFSRFDDRLRAIGLLPEDRAEYPLEVELRDPGLPLEPGTPIPEDLSSRPWTEPVALAISRRNAPPGQRLGVMLEPYQNYLGRQVVGGWLWRPVEGSGFGVLVELDTEEALAPMRYLNFTFGLLLTILGVLGLVALVSVIRSMRLQRTVGRLRQMGAYTIDRLLGVGGMGEVYLAHHSKLKRPVAVKVIRPDQVSSEAMERFEREVQMASQLTHPNTIEIHDYGRAEDGTFYYAMEFVDGPDLAAIMAAGGAIPPARVIHVLRQVCLALGEAHDRGLVHRDIKPQNIMLCERGGEPDVVKVLDFGLVKQIERTHSIDPSSLKGVRGSPMYMAPERFQDPLHVDARIDIYAIGAVAYELLTARPILDIGDNPLDLIYRVVEEEPWPLDQVADQAAPAALADLVMQCLAKDREQRPRRIKEVIARLEDLALEYPWPRDSARGWWREWRGAA